jgi:hypothetical protein
MSSAGVRLLPDPPVEKLPLSRRFGGLNAAKTPALGRCGLKPVSQHVCSVPESGVARLSQKPRNDARFAAQQYVPALKQVTVRATLKKRAGLSLGSLFVNGRKCHLLTSASHQRKHRRFAFCGLPQSIDRGQRQWLLFRLGSSDISQCLTARCKRTICEISF